MRLEQLDDTTLQTCSPERLITLITRVQQLIEAATAYQRRLIAIAEKRKAARAVGDINTADSLVRTTGISRRRARRAQRQAKTIAKQPEIADALAAGTLTAEQAETIAQAEISDQTRNRLLKAAATRDNADTTRLRTAAAQTDERDESPEERFMRQRSKRFLRFYNNHDGMICLHGAMDPDTGARVKARITAIAKHMWRQDKHQPHNQRRTPQQRDIDALHTATTPQPPTPPTPQPSAPAAPVSQPPTPAVSQPPAPAVSQSPAPAVSQSPAPAVSQSPAPAVSQSPAPAVSQSPAPAAPQSDDGVAPQLPVDAESQPPAPRSDARSDASRSSGRSSGGEQSRSWRWGDPASQSSTGLGERDVMSSERSRREPDQPGPDRPYDRHAATNHSSSDSGLSHPRFGHSGSDRSNVLLRHGGACIPGAAPTTTTSTANGAIGSADGVDDAAVRSVSGAGVEGYRWRGRPLPLLRVSTSLDNLKDGLHRAGITDSGDHLSAQTLRRLACDAQIIPVVLNSKSRVVDVGRRTRVISEALRIAVIHRDKHCVWPGCSAPPDRCDCHHVEHWINGGPTNLDNLALLCHRHHILLHEAHYRLHRHDNTWTVHKPDNTPLHTNPTPNPTTQHSHPLII